MISAGVLHRLPSERATEPFALLRVLPRRRFIARYAGLRLFFYQRTKFQLSSSISFGDMRGSVNKKWELLISPDVPSVEIFIQGASTRKCLQVCQISSS